jgi:hypothetical protein
VVRIWVKVIVVVVVGYFLQFVRGDGMEEVADIFLAFVFYGVMGHFFGCVSEGLREGQRVAFVAIESGGFNELTRLGVGIILGEKGPYRCIVAYVAGEKGSEFAARASLNAVSDEVLRMAACSEVDWLMRSLVLACYS